MPKFIIEREISDAGSLTTDELQGISQKSCSVLKNLGTEIQWVESYVTKDKVYCVYIAPNEDLIKDALVRQLYSSVRWVETIEYMEQQGVDILLELGPGKILTSFNKRIDNSIKSLSVSDANSLENALENVTNI